MAYELSKKERREIQLTFRDVRGVRLTNQQRDIVRRFDLEYGIGRNSHAFIAYDGHKITFPLTPGCRNVGRKLAKYLIDLIERHYQVKVH